MLVRLASIISAVSLLACALPAQRATQQVSAAGGDFNPKPNMAKLFVFPEYSSTGNRAYFDTGAHNASREARQRPTYQLTVDGHYVATFSDTQFIEMNVRPGKYSLDVEERGWLDTSLGKATVPANIDSPGQIIFIAIPSSPAGIRLQMVDAHYGKERIAGLEKAATYQN